jgi:hypothetical protein
MDELLGWGEAMTVFSVYLYLYIILSQGYLNIRLSKRPNVKKEAEMIFQLFFPSVLKLPTVCIFYFVFAYFLFSCPPPFSRFITLCYTHFARNTFGNMKWSAAKLRRRASHTTANEALVGAGGLLWVPTETRQEFSISLSSFDIRKACTPLRKLIALSAREAQVKEKRSKKKIKFSRPRRKIK